MASIVRIIKEKKKNKKIKEKKTNADEKSV